MSEAETPNSGELILDEKDIAHKLHRVALEIIERHPDGNLVFVGIHKRGVTVAERVLEFLKREESLEVPMGTIDINFYRDDLHHLSTNPEVLSSEIGFPVEGARVVLFDDVLYTGRTIRAAIEALMSYGRPAFIELAVLVDRGNRELPFEPNYVGHEMETEREDYVRVRLKGIDEEDSVVFFSGGKP
jgi:pyrimidine operon attenuation protein/uracil phosphoribosyltransferase